jgi:transcription antitermination protein NusB
MRGSRRKAREDAVQVLYQLDLNNTLTPGAALTHFESLYNPEGGPLDEFTRRLVVGVAESVAELDATIGKFTQNWRKDRMPAVDRNIVRLGVYELQYCDDIPSTVSINEMVELAKSFGSESTAAFVNGILDKVKGSLDRPGKAK